MFPPDTLDTERLHLRRPTLDDAQTLYEGYCSDPLVSRYMTWPPHTSVDDTLAFLQASIDAWDSGRGHMSWIMDHRRLGRPVGSIGVTVLLPRVVVGYVLERPLWGRGLVAEALIAVCDASLSDPEIYRVEALCDVDNTASARVMDKAGMVFEGTLRRYMVHPAMGAEPRDCHLYALVKGMAGL